MNEFPPETQADTIEAMILRRMLHFIIAGVAMVLVGAVGVGAFFATTRVQLDAIHSQLAQMNDRIMDTNQRMGSVETAIHREILPEAEARLDMMEAWRLDISVRMADWSSRLDHLELEIDRQR